ncbi:MAG: MFS transporter, partial [Gammaproteobacteria bacterium]|nr:MFS transporter [Gammaproteobacteria bacterium]
ASRTRVSRTSANDKPSSGEARTSSDASQPHSPGVRGLLAQRDFLFVWGVGGLTGIVRWLHLLVMGLYTFEITGSPLLVSMVPMLWMLPLALCGPLVGVLADRVSRKVLLCATIGMVLGVSIWMAGASLGGELSFTHIAIASVLSGLFWATDMPVRRRLLGDLSGEAVSTAMSLDSATGNATRMAGPLLGGVILQSFSIAGVFLFSSVIFAGCLTLILLTRVPGRQVAASTFFVRELYLGIHYVLHSARLRRLLAITIIFNLWGFPFTSMIPIVGSARLGLDPFQIGILSSMEGLGAFLGALSLAMLARPGVFFRIYVGGTIGYLSLVAYLGMLAYVAGGPLHSFLFCAGTLVCIGMSGACFAAMQGTLTYLEAPPAYRSRVLGVLTLCIGSGPLGFLNIGWMAESFGVSTALILSGAEGLLALLALWAFGRDVDLDRPRDEPQPAPATESARDHADERGHD